MLHDAMLRRVWPWLLGLWVLTACHRQPVAFEYQSAPMDGWEQGDTLKFHIDTLRQDGDYLLSLGVRTSVATPYPFQSLWLVVRQHWHHPEQLVTDTVECRLADSRGDVQGHGVTLYTYTRPVRPMQLAAGAWAEVSVIHIMRREILPGVHDVGIRLALMPDDGL